MCHHFFMSDIDDYLEQYDPAIRQELERIRGIAKKLMPGCEEVISYNMPTLKYKGKSIIGFDAHKNHIGIYPYSGHVISAIKDLDKYMQTKGSIQEKLDDLLPEELIKKIISVRLE